MAKDRKDLTAPTTEQDPPTPPAADTPSGDASEAAPPVEGSQQQAAAEADVTARLTELDDLRAKLDTAEKKRIPDLQRQIAAKEADVRKAMDTAKNFRSSMLEWVRRELIAAGAEDRWRDIERREQEATGRVLETQAQRADTMEIINDLLDNDEPDSRAFGRFLKAQVKAGQQAGTPVRITRDNVDAFREMFDTARGVAVSSNAPAATDSTSQPAARPSAVAAAPKTPVRTVTPAAPPQGNPEPPVYEQAKGSARGMFGMAFRKREGTE